MKTFNNDEKTRQLLTEYFQTYPNLQAEDVFKLLFQSSFGCEHLVTDFNFALTYINDEWQNVQQAPKHLVERLDGDYSRVHLACLTQGLAPQTLAKLFCMSAQREADGLQLLQQKLLVATSLVECGTLPLDKQLFHKKLNTWRELGYPAIHHSQAFRSSYKPAYRVIANKYAKFLSVFTQIDKLLAKGDVVVAIEGGSASGKSTLANLLSQVYDCNVIHMDDFFLRPEQRTTARFDEIGGNVDYERFEEQVVVSLRQGNDVTLQPFDCSTQTLGRPQLLPHKRLTIVEGVYSMHPHFGNYFNLSVFLDISPNLQKQRVLVRNPSLANRFFEEWIPLENRYFDGANVQGRCAIVVDVNNND